MRLLVKLRGPIFVAAFLVGCLALAAPSPATAQSCQSGCEAAKDFCEEEYCGWNPNDYMCSVGCDLEYFDCLCEGCNQKIDLSKYFIPSYSGWQKAKKVMKYKNGSTDYFRLYKVSTGKYRLLKGGTGKNAETFKVNSNGIYVTSETGAVTESDPRIFKNKGLFFLPRYICPSNAYFRPKHDGEQFIDPNTCSTTGQTTGPHTFRYNAWVEFVPGWDYGYQVGEVDSIVIHARNDDGKLEKYWYGLNRGLLRWEIRSSSGQLINSVAQTREIANSPIPLNTCDL